MNQFFYTNDLTISDTRILIYDAHIKCGKIDKTKNRAFLSDKFKSSYKTAVLFLQFSHSLFSFSCGLFSCSFHSFVNFAKYHFYHHIRRQNANIEFAHEQV